MPVSTGFVKQVTGQVTVGTTATLISAADGHREGLILINHGTTDVFVGNSNVTTTTGILLTGVKGTSLSISTRTSVYGIVVSGTQTISFLSGSNA